MTALSVVIVIVHVFNVATSHPFAIEIGRAQGMVMVTCKVTTSPRENAFVGQDTCLSKKPNEHEIPLGPVTVPAYGPLRFSPWVSVRVRTGGPGGGPGIGGGGAAAIVAVTGCPAIVAVHVFAAPVLAPAASVTVALAFPLEGDTVRAASLLDAVHEDGEHPSGAAVTATSRVPPADANETVAGETENTHGTVTSRACLADSPKYTAEISAIPGATAVIMPVSETLTLVGSEDDHRTPAAWSNAVAFESVIRT